MLKPLETIMPTLQRVRVVQATGIVETEQLIKRQIDNSKYIPRLIKYSVQITHQSHSIFSNDEACLFYLFAEMLSGEYMITRPARQRLLGMLSGIYSDCNVFRNFKETIKPLFDSSTYLEELTIATNTKANSTKKYGKRIETISGIEVPKIVQ